MTISYIRSQNVCRVCEKYDDWTNRSAMKRKPEDATTYTIRLAHVCLSVCGCCGKIPFFSKHSDTDEDLYRFSHSPEQASSTAPLFHTQQIKWFPIYISIVIFSPSKWTEKKNNKKEERKRIALLPESHRVCARCCCLPVRIIIILFAMPLHTPSFVTQNEY